MARAALAACLLSSLAPSLQAQVWTANGTGQNGLWSTPDNWDSAATPDGTQNVTFELTSSLSSPTAEVRIESHVNATTGTLYVKRGKNVTFLLEDGASLTTQNFVVGSGSTISSSHATIQGPETGSAAVNIARIILTEDTGGPNSLLLTGPGLRVNLSGSSHSNFNNGASLTISGGASLIATTAANGEFNIRTGQNRITVENGRLEGRLVENYGTLQVGTQGVVATAASAGSEMSLRTRGGGRMEAEGSGIASDVTMRIDEGGTFAVGITDAATGQRSEAAKFTLNGQLQLQSKSTLEIGIFDAGPNGIDQIELATNGWVRNVGEATVLKLTLHGDTLKEGDSWTVFTGNTTGIDGKFDLTQIDTTLWDLSNFNEAGGWKVVALVPEPSHTAMLLLSGIGCTAWALRRMLSASIQIR